MIRELLLSSAINETGQRENNEDSIFPNSEISSSLTNLFLVCDGVGGHAKGEIASDLVCSQMARYYEQEQIEVSTPHLIEQGVLFVENQFDSYMLSNPDSLGMGTTLTLLHLHQQGASLAHIGDSRIYHLRGGKILFRTKDHSYVQTLVDLGEITEEEAPRHPTRNEITNAIQGASVRRAKPSQHHIRDLRAGDLFILCTDGVLESVTDDDFMSFSREGYGVDTIALKIRMLCQGHSRDNFSAYIIKLTDEYIYSLEIPRAGEVLNSTSAMSTSSQEQTISRLSEEQSSTKACSDITPEPAGIEQGYSNTEALDHGEGFRTPTSISTFEINSCPKQSERPNMEIFASPEVLSMSPSSSLASVSLPSLPSYPSDPTASVRSSRRMPVHDEFGAEIPQKSILNLSNRMLLYIGGACLALLLALGTISVIRLGKDKAEDNKIERPKGDEGIKKSKPQIGQIL